MYSPTWFFDAYGHTHVAWTEGDQNYVAFESHPLEDGTDHAGHDMEARR